MDVRWKGLIARKKAADTGDGVEGDKYWSRMLLVLDILSNPMAVPDTMWTPYFVCNYGQNAVKILVQTLGPGKPMLLL